MRPPASGRPALPDGGRILVRGNNWVGDVVLSTPALHAIRRALPGAHIALLAKPWVTPVVAANPDIDEIIGYDATGRHRGFAGVHRLALDLKRCRFDAVLLLQRAFEAAWISRVAGIPVRAGYRTDGRSFLLTHGVKWRKEARHVHRVEHNLQLLRALGIPPSREALVQRVGARELEEARTLLGSLGIDADRRLLGLSPGAAFGPAKRWFPERFAATADRLHGETGATVLVFGSEQERPIGEEVLRAVSSAPAHNLAGATSLGTAIALIGLCGHFLTNDSGLMHVAAAVDVPLVAVFGPTDPRVTAPWCERRRVVREEGLCCSPCLERTCREEHHRCMDAVSVEKVVEASGDLLGSHGFPSVRERMGALVTSAHPVPFRSLGPAGNG